MLTRNGIGLTVLCGILVAAGWFLGVGDLYYPAAAGASLLVVALGLVWLRPIGIEVIRTVEPARVPAGDAATVHIELRNHNRLGTPVLELGDQVSGTDGTRMLVPRVARGSSHRARYQLPTRRRGRICLGPMVISLTDPFGLAKRRFGIPITADLTVYPRPVDTGPPPLTMSVDPRSHAGSATRVSVGDEDLYSLRSYAPGDDLRRVHWPASAHSDDLVVRQEEVAWQSHCTILIDTREDTMSPAGLDSTVEIAAGLVLGAAQRSNGLRLCTTGGYDSGTSAGPIQRAHCLAELAVLTTGPGKLATLLAEIDGPDRRPTTLIALTAALNAADYAQLARLAHRTPLFHFVTDTALHTPVGSLGGYSTVVNPADAAGSVRSAFAARTQVGRARRW